MGRRVPSLPLPDPSRGQSLRSGSESADPISTFPLSARAGGRGGGGGGKKQKGPRQQKLRREGGLSQPSNPSYPQPQLGFLITSLVWSGRGTIFMEFLECAPLSHGLRGPKVPGERPLWGVSSMSLFIAGRLPLTRDHLCGVSSLWLWTLLVPGPEPGTLCISCLYP